MFQKAQSLRQNLHYLTTLPRVSWRRPGHCDILIFDRVGSEVIRDALPQCRVRVLEVRGESVNLPILLRSIFTGHNRHHSVTLANRYVDEYIRMCLPKLVITFIDNNPGFYSLHSRHPNVKTAFVQNGVRDTQFDLFSHLKRNPDYFVDRMYTFSNAMSEEYLNRIQGTVLSIGSMKNNAVRVLGETLQTSKRVIWVSQWLGRNEPDGKFSEHDAGCVKAVFDWCSLRNLELAILGRDRERRAEEHAFYREAIGSDDFVFVSSGDADVYTEVDASFLVVTVDSTLGYEALARGKRVAFFCYRSTVFGNSSLNFGWPTIFEAQGEIWTSSTKAVDWAALLTRVADLNTSDWIELCERYRQILTWDPGNLMFKKDVLELLS